jgi:hypothetical protein
MSKPPSPLKNTMVEIDEKQIFIVCDAANDESGAGLVSTEACEGQEKVLKQFLFDLYARGSRLAIPKERLNKAHFVDEKSSRYEEGRCRRKLSDRSAKCPKVSEPQAPCPAVLEMPSSSATSLTNILVSPEKAHGLYTTSQTPITDSSTLRNSYFSVTNLLLRASSTQEARFGLYSATTTSKIGRSRTKTQPVKPSGSEIATSVYSRSTASLRSTILRPVDAFPPPSSLPFTASAYPPMTFTTSTIPGLRTIFGPTNSANHLPDDDLSMAEEK